MIRTSPWRDKTIVLRLESISGVTQLTSRVTRFMSCVTQLTSHVTQLASRVTHLGSRVTQLTLRVTQLISRVTHPISAVTLLTLHVTQLLARVTRLMRRVTQQASAVTRLMPHVTQRIRRVTRTNCMNRRGLFTNADNIMPSARRTLQMSSYLFSGVQSLAGRGHRSAKSVPTGTPSSSQYISSSDHTPKIRIRPRRTIRRRSPCGVPSKVVANC